MATLKNCYRVPCGRGDLCRPPPFEDAPSAGRRLVFGLTGHSRLQVHELDRSTLDGNAAGGLLLEVFAFEATLALTTCAGCGRTRPMAELMLYAVELGASLRCPSCDQAVVRIGRTPRGLWLDLRGATTIVAADPAAP